MGQRWKQRQRTLLAVAGLGWLTYKALQWGRQENLSGQVVLITGGSRGLGLALAREFARVGCRLVLAARDAQELARAQQDLTQRGTEVLAVPCDVTNQEQVRSVVDQATQRFGRVDIVVNNAGIIQVGPMSTTTVEDFASALDVMFWGALYPTLAVLPQMRARRSGHIVNITSIGGMVSVPHLLPYTCAKFAAVGLSKGLRAELGQEGIHVTTVVLDGGAATPPLAPLVRSDGPGPGGHLPLASVYARRGSVGTPASGAATSSLSRIYRTTGFTPLINAAAYHQRYDQ